MEEFVKNKPKHLKQPFLVCLGTLIAPKQFFLVVDFYVIDCGSECSNAFNVLFSSFFAFNTEYPKPVLTEFYQFFEYAVYGIVPSCSCNIGAFVSKLVFAPYLICIIHMQRSQYSMTQECTVFLSLTFSLNFYAFNKCGLNDLVCLVIIQY